MGRCIDMGYSCLATIILLALFAFLPGCYAEHIPTAPSAALRSDSTYIGSWNWTKSVGGYAGRTENPESEGYTLRIELTPDSVYRVCRSGILTISRRFSIYREEGPGSSDSVDVIGFPGLSVYPPAWIRLLGRDTLNLIDRYMDGYTRFYTRAG